MKKLHQAGFTLVEGLLVIIALSGVIGVGSYIMNTNRAAKTNNSAPKQVHATTSKTKRPYQAPVDYITFSNKDLGFSFAYPEQYGTLIDQPTVGTVGVKKTSTPAAEYSPGVQGEFTLYSYPTSDTPITSRKYGPKIKLQQSKWVVTETNPADTEKNVLGQYYKAPSNQPLTAQVNNGLTVWGFQSNDEGSEVNSFVFTVKGKLYQLQIPTYEDGLYVNPDKNALPNDKTEFTGLFFNVLNSIHSLQ